MLSELDALASYVFQPKIFPAVMLVVSLLVVASLYFSFMELLVQPRRRSRAFQEAFSSPGTMAPPDPTPYQRPSIIDDEVRGSIEESWPLARIPTTTPARLEAALKGQTISEPSPGSWHSYGGGQTSDAGALGLALESSDPGGGVVPQAASVVNGIERSGAQEANFPAWVNDHVYPAHEGAAPSELEPSLRDTSAALAESGILFPGETGPAPFPVEKPWWEQ